MLTSPVAAARAAVATGAWVKSKHDGLSDTWYVEVLELKLYFYPSAGGLKKKEKKLWCWMTTGRKKTTVTVIGYQLDYRSSQRWIPTINFCDGL